MKPDWSFDPILPHMSEEIASRNWRDNCLLTLGWATRTIGSFDERVIVTWIAVTPVVMFGAHLLTPVLLPRLLAAEGLKRVAVIAKGRVVASCQLDEVRGDQSLEDAFVHIVGARTGGEEGLSWLAS